MLLQHNPITYTIEVHTQWISQFTSNLLRSISVRRTSIKRFHYNILRRRPIGIYPVYPLVSSLSWSLMELRVWCDNSGSSKTILRLSTSWAALCQELLLSTFIRSLQIIFQLELPYFLILNKNILIKFVVLNEDIRGHIVKILGVVWGGGKIICVRSK